MTNVWRKEWRGKRTKTWKKISEKERIRRENASLRIKKYKFSKTNQPTKEARKQGRVKRKQAKMMMDYLNELQYMSKWELKKYLEINIDDLPVGQLILISYINDILSKPSARRDWINRHIWYARHDNSNFSEENANPTFSRIEVTIND